VHRYIQAPVQHPAIVAALGVPASGGVIIHGSRGTGRTTLLAAIGRGTRVHHQLCKCADILSGGAAQRLPAVFAEAHRRAPSLLLLDDADELLRDFSRRRLAPQRRVAALLLYLLDRTFAQPGVVVVAAVESMSNVDPILLRSGRFVVDIGLQQPGPTERGAAISLNASGLPLDEPTIARLSAATNGMMFGEIQKIVRIAVNRMFKRAFPSGVSEWHALDALNLEVADFPIDVPDGEPEHATPGDIQPSFSIGSISLQQPSSPARVRQSSSADSVMERMDSPAPAAQQQAAPVSSGPDLSLFGSVAQKPSPLVSAGGDLDLFSGGQQRPLQPANPALGTDFDAFPAGQPQKPAVGPSLDIFLGGQQQQPPSPSHANFDRFPDGKQQQPSPPAPSFDILRSDQAPFLGGQQRSAPTSYGPGPDFPSFVGTQQQPSTPKPVAGSSFDLFKTAAAPELQRRVTAGAINPYALSDQQFAVLSAGNGDAQGPGRTTTASSIPHINPAVSGVAPGMQPQAAA
jgi:hypothetical protein